MSARRVFDIGAGEPFLRCLALGLLADAGDDVLSLADHLVLLPTRRACRGLQDAFLEISGDRALVLPRIAPLGDIDEDDGTLAAFPEAGIGPAPDLPPAVTPVRRHVLLTRLILDEADRHGFVAGPEQAASLARSLAAFLDEVQIEQKGFDGLHALVPDIFAEHWQRTLDILSVVTEAWPRALAEAGEMDPIDRRNALVAALIGRWNSAPPAGHVTAAGSTGSIPATRALLVAVAGLPRGRVVLSGLDHFLDEQAWTALDETHGQFHLARLLSALDMTRADVRPWPHSVRPGSRARQRLVSEALRPAETTGAWTGFRLDLDEALRGVRRIDAPGLREESDSIALVLRHALETPGKTATLITADPALGRAVAASLRRWGIDIDSSAGRPVKDTVPGGFLRLIAALAADGPSPVPLLAVLKHPLASGGLEPAAFRADARVFERLVLRGPRPAPDLVSLRHALDAARGDDAPPLPGFEAFARIAAPFLALAGRRSVPFAAMIETHLGFAEALAATATVAGDVRLWQGEAGQTLAALFDDLLAAAPTLPSLAPAAYLGLFDEFLEGLVVRGAPSRHPRLTILGPLEARLQTADLVVLGGLNEGVWPPEPRDDPWMNRPMRKTFGLPLPERRVGLSALDFTQAMMGPEVVLTRSLRTDGAPTVPSRWLMRLDAVIDAARGAAPAPPCWSGAEATRLLGWQAALDAPAGPGPVSRPAPCPPAGARPRSLSITEIGTWLVDPYAIYARRVLDLEPLDPIDADPGAADRGILIHDALDRFVTRFPKDLPADADAELLAIGREVFAPYLDRPSVAAFWWPRFEAVAAWFVAWERARRPGLHGIFAERRASMTFGRGKSAFTLIGRADRIEQRADGTLAIADYKTGAAPAQGDIALGLAPQLALEAMMAEAGAFDGVPAGAVRSLFHLILAGGDPAGDERPVAAPISDLIDQSRAGLQALIRAFQDPGTPYLSRPDGGLDRNGAYDGLARPDEWLVFEDGGGGDRGKRGPETRDG